MCKSNYIAKKTVTFYSTLITKFQETDTDNDITRVSEVIFQTPRPQPVITTYTNYPALRDGHNTPHYQVGKVVRLIGSMIG